MTEHLPEAPIADWVTIPDLHRDPFPIFERLRAEGGVHWVPAVGRYLVTSYHAVHETELDQETFSANEEGSLMIRAMGHSMLRRDDPEHQIERRAWQPVLRPGVVKRTWLPIFERNAQRYLDRFQDMGPGADLVWDFAAPYAAENLRAVIGLHNATQEDLQRWSQTMIDATGNYADDPVVWAKGQASYDEVDAALDDMLDWHQRHPDDSLLSALLAMPDYQMPLAAIRANVKMTIGGGLNEPRDAIGVASWALLRDPAQQQLVKDDPSLWNAVFDETLRWIAPIGMYSRQTTRETELAGVRLPSGAKLGICILSANRDGSVWEQPDTFNIRRTGDGAHLAFGKGVHVCLGAWVARAEVAAVALPRLFEQLDGLSLDPADPAQVGGWVFRGMTRLPVRWQENTAKSALPSTPRIAIIGAGPSGLYTDKALLKTVPGAEITVLERLPVPFGLVRYGVAADHQGTKAVCRQFARLFEKDGVEFVGSVEVGKDIQLDELRAAFDAVVLATGLHQDVPLDVEGARESGLVYGAGRITRLLNGHPDEVRPAPCLGASTAVIGQGNVAMDLVRLLTKTAEELEGSDIDDAAHTALTASLRVVHVIGRSGPRAAKFDPAMLREIIDLPGIDHIVHGVTAELDPTDPREALVAGLITSPRNETARIRIEWWFGQTPKMLQAHHDSATLFLAGSEEKGSEIEVDSVITAIGFGSASSLSDVDDAASETGRIETGLYVAGWLRRGPRGTIPSQRSDSRELAETIAADLGGRSTAPGRRAIAHRLGRSTSYDGWLVIEAHEVRAAAPGRLRRKLTDPSELRLVASSASCLPFAEDRAPTPVVAESAPELTIAYASESGNSELVAGELAAHLAAHFRTHVIDLAAADPASLVGCEALVLCSTYGDGELPTGARTFQARLEANGTDLSTLKFALFALGDHSYSETYSRGGELLAGLLESHGARRHGPIGRHDAAGRELAPALAIAWADNVLQRADSDHL